MPEKCETSPIFTYEFFQDGDFIKIRKEECDKKEQNSLLIAITKEITLLSYQEFYEDLENYFRFEIYKKNFPIRPGGVFGIWIDHENDIIVSAYNLRGCEWGRKVIKEAVEKIFADLYEGL